MTEEPKPKLKSRNRKPGRPPYLMDPRKARPEETIGGGFFIFRRGRNTGRVQAPEWPFEHPNRESAEAEAAKLAQRFPGEVFEVFGRVSPAEGGAA